MPIYQIAVLLTPRDFFNYHHEDASIPIGTRVWVPFRQSTKLGVVVGISDVDADITKLKTILEVIDKTPILTADLLHLCRWVSAYYQSPLSHVLALALPKMYRNGKTSASLNTLHYELTMPVCEAHQQLNDRAQKQHQLIDYIGQHSPVCSKHCTQAGYSSALLKSLFDKNIVRQVLLPSKPTPVPVQEQAALHLNSEQALALDTIKAALDHYHCFLLYGVTGSGKTEVYAQLISEVLAKGQQVLILVPEIGLTPQLKQRFQARFAESMVVVHSQMNETERQQAWQWALDQQVQLVIGTRSALFTPMPALGLIIIDEEHDTSLKQMEGVRYLARDTALMRAQAANIPIILGSATPSLESLANVAKGKYSVLHLHNKAMTQTPLHYQLVDLRSQTLQHGFTNQTLAVMKRHVDDGNQVLIFINRRGFSPVLLCHLCAWKAVCPGCDACLTVHKTKHQLICHHCGYTQRQMHECPSCHGRELLYLGAGTQRIEESLHALFPTTSILRIDRDVVRKKHQFDQHLETIHAGKVQLIIGTQMLAKGHHFSRLSLVVVLDADHGFYSQDFRALEHFGQLMTQVSGRAGREAIAGEVILQTHLPDHPLLLTLIQHGYEPFAQALLSLRKEAGLPPYTFMALIRAEGKQQANILGFMHAIKQLLSDRTIHMLGPAPAPLGKKAHQYRMQLLLKSNSRQGLQAALTHFRTWVATHKAANKLHWTIDVDPLDLS